MFAALLDVKFDQLITRRLLSVIYVLAAAIVALAGVSTAVWLLGNFGGGGVMVTLLVVVPGTVMNLLLVRVLVEAIVVYFRLGEDVRALRDASKVVAS